MFIPGRKHPLTNRSPAELLFNRRVRGKLPDLSQGRGIDQAIMDHDSEEKAKSKLYANTRRGAKPSNICPGDQVLVKQDKTNKLTTTFAPTPHVVKSMAGNSVVIEAADGAQYSRLKYETPAEAEQTTERAEADESPLTSNQPPDTPPCQETPKAAPTQRRSQRNLVPHQLLIETM